MNPTDKNQQYNQDHYERLYANYSIKNILWWLDHLEGYLNFVTNNETSWYAIYQDNFRKRIQGRKVLEMGCGDCTNAAVMAALGAEVYANDIASSSGDIVRKLNDSYAFPYPIKFIEGDFLENDLASNSFDFVVGKSFLHHLTLPVEEEFIMETARLLKEKGEARFFEPAVNNKVLDEIRWHIPVKGRPSKFNHKAFLKWKEEDPHPDRDLSSGHFLRLGTAYFKKNTIMPIGTLERLRRIVPNVKRSAAYTRWALKNEKKLPAKINNSFARSQLIIFSDPIEA